MKVGDQVWVTAAVDDVTAIKVMVLGRSLKRSLTSHRIAVVVANNVSDKMRKLLASEFDQLLKMDGASEMNGLPLILHSKIYCWALPFVKKVAFLNPNCFVVRNSDELFEIQDGNVAVRGTSGEVDSGLMIMKPDPELFEDLMDAIKDRKIHSGEFAIAERELANWLVKCGQLRVELDQRYSVKVVPNGTGSVLTNDEKDVSIVEFLGMHPLDTVKKVNGHTTSSGGILEQALSNLWREIYLQDVQPQLNQIDARVVRPELPSSFTGVEEPIAIVGLSCRFPGADSVEEYWDVLINGRDMIRKVPDDRWPSAKSADFREVAAGFLKCPVDSFDGKFFGISPADLINTDPQQRLLMECVWEALEDAGLNPQSLKGTATGVFVGSWTTDYRDLINDNVSVDNELSEFHRLYMGNSLGGTGGRLSFLLGLTGPNVATESGCSSGMAAIYLATESLRASRCRVAIAGGVNLLLHPFKRKHMQSIIAADGRCKTFDEKADGFGRGEGVASLILKKYSDAVKDGDKVRALILGAGMAQEGISRSFGTPTAKCQELAMECALNNAGISAKDVAYVEAHGTGTMVGDPVEMAAITKVYSKDRVEPLIVASGKTNIGHTESCSGFAGIIKVILAMQHDLIPPHINLDTINPHINLDAIPAIIPREPLKWTKGVGGLPRLVGISSFGITGTDAHIILQEPPKYTPKKAVVETKERPLHLMTISSKSETGLEQVLQNYDEFLETSKDLELSNVAYSANTGRAHFPYRVALIAKDLAELTKKVKGAVGSSAAKHVPEEKPKICFLFTGQGSQYEGMSKDLYESSPTFKMNFDKCDQILQKRFSLDLKPVLWGDKSSLLKRSLYSQTSIFVVEFALMKLWSSWGITPDFVLGHSLGEFAAATCAGILTLDEALTLVAERSRLIEAQREGRMLVIKADKPQVNRLMKEFLPTEKKDAWMDYAAVNSQDQTVVAGPIATIEEFKTFLTAKGLKCTVLEATNAFHSRDMDPMLKAYEQIASKIPSRQSSDGIGYISGLTGQLETGEITSSYWIRHTREAVSFLDASQTAWHEGARVFLEIGPQPVLSALTLGNVGDFGEEVTLLPSLRRKENEWTTLLGSVSKLYVGGFSLDWVRFDQFYIRNKVGLPFYPFNRKVFWYNQGKGEGDQGIQQFNAANAIHPMLGHVIPNAMGASLFQGSVNLDRHAYIKDHCIGQKVIFPGAGYLEMAIAAGNASTSIQKDGEQVQMPANPVSIEGLTIEAPLAIEEGVSVHLQTVVSEDVQAGDTKIQVYSLRAKKWMRQATASFLPLPMTYVPEPEQVSKDSLDTILERCSQNEIDLGDFYDKLETVGLQFGPTFRSLKKVFRGNDRENLCEIDIPEGAPEYILHPIVLDALIQATMVGITRPSDSLFVPISIGKLVCFAQKSETATKYYAHCHWNTDGPDGRVSVLYDDTGKLIAFMEGIQVIETSVIQILKALDNQKLSLPNMYEEAWRPKTGIWKMRTNIAEIARDRLFSDELFEEIDKSNELDAQSQKMKRLRGELVYMYALRSFYDVGWTCPKNTGASLVLSAFMQFHGILKGQERFLTRLFSICEEEGLLKRKGNLKEWTIIKLFPTESQVHARLREIHTEFDRSNEEGEPKDVKVMSACGEQLSKILQGKTSALAILFPEDKDTEICAETYYHQTPLLKAGGYVLLNKMFTEIFCVYPDLCEDDKGIIRILEVGAGTGSSTIVFLEVLEKFGVRYQYTFTDISPAFFIKARQTFESYGKKLNYKVLNIEEDPSTQGFAQGTYDYVFASNAIHATRDLKESIQHMRQLIRPKGMLMLAETLEPLRDIDIVFGVLEGFWKFSDTDVRAEHPFVGADVWTKIIADAGHSRIRAFRCYGSTGGGVLAQVTDDAPVYKSIREESSENVWLYFGNKKTYQQHLHQHFKTGGRKVLLVQKSKKYNLNESTGEIHLRVDEKADMEALFEYLTTKQVNVEGILYMWGLDKENPEGVHEDAFRTTHPFLFMAQVLLSQFKGFPKLVVVTEGIMPISDESAVDIAQATLWGMARCFRSEQSAMFVRCVDLDPDEPDLELKYKELYAELWFDDNDYQIAYRGSSRHVCRFITNKELSAPLPLPSSKRFSLVLPSTKNIADLTFCANGKPALKEGYVEIQVKVVGLNFRDIFVVLKPDKAFDKYNTVGLEFAGVVSALGPNVTKVKVGDKVIGCNFRGDALPSHPICEVDALIPMPEGMTFHEATTLPAAFATVYYCLVEVANLKKGETVLIHAGSGGVGLYAIQVAQALGARIITTAGSRRKRAYLRGLGVEHVFHSRNTDYGKQILEILGGPKVDVVLNCLTSPGFKEASLDACAKGARFLEISKMAIWSVEEVKEMRPDVDYSIIDLTTVTNDSWRTLWESLKTFYAKGFLTPIPYVRFDAQHIRDALLYMQKAKHIGKVLITFPEPAKREESERKTLKFNPDSTYLITGGLGGIGLEVAKWMTDSGAQNIVLVSRRPANEKSAKIINELLAKGKNIIVKSLDVGEYSACKALIDHIQSGGDDLPPLRGVMHCAGSLHDATYLNQNVETFNTVFKGKVGGAWNLHRLTSDCRLEHFVLYSSIVSIFGPIGLSNYSAANTYLDALAHYRNALGLTAQSINWGQWAEVGAAANINMIAVKAFSPAQGIAALDVIMKGHKTQSCVLEVDFSAARKLTGHAGAYLEELKISKNSQQVTFNIKMERFWEEYESAVDEKKRDVIKAYIEMILRQILKFDEDEPIEENQPFSEMGMDSLMMLEMKNFIQTMLGKSVTMNVSVMQELTTVAKLVDHLQSLIEKMGQDEENTDPASYDTFSDELINLINKDMVLDEIITPAADAEPAKTGSDIKNVLLTGVTGKFGPWMLRGLLKNPNIEKVYCIIRSTIGGKRGGEKVRLRGVLESLKLDKEVNLAKVETISGDITEKMFGLFKNEWEELAERVDAIVHCAVKGNLLDPYTRISKEGTTTKGMDIRTPNVLGTINVMELAVTGARIKSFFHASTLLANQKVNVEENRMSEEWYAPEEVFQLKNTGYPVSKFICEVLLRQLSDRGVPVHIFRFPALFGDSRTGRFTLQNNHAVIRLLGFCKLGAIPAIPLPIQVLPSDLAADLTLEIFFSDHSPTGVYNVSNPHLNYFHDFAKASGEHGFPIEVVEYDVFAKKLSENEEYKALFPYSEVDMDEGRYVDFSTSPQALQAWIKNPDGFFPSKRMLSMFPDLYERIETPVATVKRDLQFAIDSGICDKFGMKRVAK